MRLIDWARDNLKRIHLFDEEVSNGLAQYADTDARNPRPIVKVRTFRDKGTLERQKKLSIALVSCDNALEFYNVVRQLCPSGTIIEPYNPVDWEDFFNAKVQMAELELTQNLLDRANRKSADSILKVLERRKRSHWGNKVELEKTDRLEVDRKPTEIRVSIEST